MRHHAVIPSLWPGRGCLPRVLVRCAIFQRSGPALDPSRAPRFKGFGTQARSSTRPGASPRRSRKRCSPAARSLAQALPPTLHPAAHRAARPRCAHDAQTPRRLRARPSGRNRTASWALASASWRSPARSMWRAPGSSAPAAAARFAWPPDRSASARAGRHVQRLALRRVPPRPLPAPQPLKAAAHTDRVTDAPRRLCPAWRCRWRCRTRPRSWRTCLRMPASPSWWPLPS